MKHRRLTHEGFTLAAIEDILDRGKMPDWVPNALAKKWRNCTLICNTLLPCPALLGVVQAVRFVLYRLREVEHDRLESEPRR